MYYTLTNQAIPYQQPQVLNLDLDLLPGMKLGSSGVREFGSSGVQGSGTESIYITEILKKKDTDPGED